MVTYLSVRDINFASLYIFLLDFETVSTVWCFVCFFVFFLHFMTKEVFFMLYFKITKRCFADIVQKIYSDRQ